MKTLVTGATGFIGANLVRFLCSKGYTIRALCRPTSDITVISENSVHIYWGDVLDLPSIERAVDGCDCVFHLAGYAKNWAKNSQTFFDVNVNGTKNVIGASKKANVKKVVFTSTCMTLGPSKDSPKEESGRRNEDFFSEYDRTKFYAEEVIADFIQRGMSVVIVNPTRLFGPGLFTEGNSVTKMIRSYLRGKWRLILSDGSAIGNYVYVEDVVRGLWLALQRGQPGEKYILGGENLSLNEFFGILADISHRRYRMIHVPSWLALTSSKFQAFLAKLFGIYPLITPDWVKIFTSDWAFSSQKAEAELGYKITPFREGMYKTLVWLNK